MKRYSAFIVLAIISLLTFSCDYLDKQPTGDMTLTEVFSERDHANRFLNNIYYDLPWELRWPDDNERFRATWTVACDEMECAYGGTYGHLMNEGAWNPTNVNRLFTWITEYRAIRKCNIFLERIGGTPMEEAERERWIGEVYFIRAFNKFLLYRAYGPIVIINRALETDEDLLAFKRSPITDVVEDILADCDEAIRHLPNTATGVMLGRATAIAALALKARTLLYFASPLWNGNTDYANFRGLDGEALVPQGYDANRWQRAADMNLQLINLAQANGINLYRSESNDPLQNFANIWQVHHNSEWIFFATWDDQHPNRCADPISISGYSILNPTQNLVDAFQMANGTDPITGYTNNGLTPVINPASGYTESGFTTEAHPQGYHPAGVHNMYANREPRFYASISFARQLWKPDITVNSRTELEFWYTGRDGRRAAGSDYCKTGYLMKKVNDHSWRLSQYGNILRPQKNVYFRLGEFYLNYAEALNEAQGPVADVYTYVNAIRDRAGLPGLPAGLSKDEMRERIIHERRIELAFESHRFFDVRRWKIAYITENIPVYGLDIMSGETRDDEAFYQRVFIEPRVFDAPRHYLVPLRTAEFDKVRTVMVQNPGWPGAADAVDD